jgi:osmotically-inducible protein OsmY
MYRDDDERRAYDRWQRYGRERGWMDKAADEVKSWFGDDEAEMRRKQDQMSGRRRDYGYESEPSYSSRRHESSGYGLGRSESYRRPNWERESRREYGYEEREPGRYGGTYRSSEYDSPDWEQEHFNPYYESRWGGNRERERFGGLNRGYGGGGIGYGGGSSYGQSFGGPGFGAGAAGSYGGTMGNSEYGMRESFAGRGSRTYQRADERIKDEVHERLARHPAIDAQELDVQVQNGEVTLSGNVVTRYEKRLAEELAEEVFGVRNVQNTIRVGRESTQGTVADGQPASSRSIRR